MAAAGVALIASTTVLGGAYVTYADDNNTSIIEELGTQTLNLVTNEKQEYEIKKEIKTIMSYCIADTREDVYSATFDWDEDKDVTDKQVEDIETAVTALNEDGKAAYADIQSAIWSIVTGETVYPNASEKKEILTDIYEGNVKDIKAKYSVNVTVSNNRHYITIKEKVEETTEAATQESSETTGENSDDDEGPTFTATTENYLVEVKTNADSFPEGTEMVVNPLNPEETGKFIREVYEQEGTEYSAASVADISFIHNGQEIEPNGEVEVTFTLNEEANYVLPDVAHLTNDGEIEMMEVEYDGNEITFETDEFSTYGVLDNVGTQKYLTMRNSDETQRMKLDIINWETGENISTYHNEMTEGQIHLAANPEETYWCGNCFNNFFTGTFTAHDLSEYMTYDQMNKIGLFLFAMEMTPEYQRASQDDKYFIKQGVIWSTTCEAWYPQDVGNGQSMFVHFENSYLQNIWEKVWGNWYHLVESNGTHILVGDTITFRDKIYKWGGTKGIAYVNEIYGFNKTKVHDGTCQSSLQVQFTVDEIRQDAVPITVIKASDETGHDLRGNISPAGIVLEMTYIDPETGNPMTETRTTDENGKAVFSFIRGIGPVSIREVSVPENSGWIKSDTVLRGEVKPVEGHIRTVFPPDQWSFENYTIDFTNIPKKSNLQITKLDNLAGAEPQGDAELTGTMFEVKNASARSIDYNGRNIPAGEAISNLTIEKDGNQFVTPIMRDLTFGTYEVKEIAAGKGYILNNEVKTINATENDKTYTVDFKNEPIKGKIQVIKEDAETKDGKTQGEAKLSEIEFKVYNNSKYPVYYQNNKVNTGTGQTDDNLVTTLVSHYNAMTDSYISDETDELPYGTYTIVETKTNASYQLTDNKPHTVMIREQGETVKTTFKDKPVKGDIRLIKEDAETKDGKPQGDADLEGVKFAVYNNSNNNGEILKTKGETHIEVGEGINDGTNYGTILYKGKEIPSGIGQTDANLIDIVATKYDKETDSYFVDIKGLPYGTYTVKEVETNGSYKLTDGSVKEFKIREQGKTYPGTFKDEVVKGKLRFIKIDAETEDGKPQGDADLSGIEFTVYNNSSNSNNGLILYEGKTIPSGKGQTEANTVAKFVTQYDEATDSYYVDTGDLPYGTYTIVETKSNGKYRLTDGKPHELKIRDEGKTVSDTWEDEVIRGKIDIVKISAELMKSIAQGGASLEDIEFKVYNCSKNTNAGKILYDKSGSGKKYPMEDMIIGADTLGEDTLVGTFTTIRDDDGNIVSYHCSTGWLPYGTYKIVETKTNTTYYLDENGEEWTEDKAMAINDKNTDLTTATSRKKTVQIRLDGETETIEKPNNVKRGDLAFSKKGETGQKSEYLPYCAFSLSLFRTKEDAEKNVNPLETHVIVTDETGSYDSTFNLHNNNTNGNDALLTAKTIKTSDIDINAGTWFSAGEDGTRNDDTIKEGNVGEGQKWGALPYGYYRLTELRCEANEDYELAVDQTFEINERYIDRGRVVDLHTFDDGTPPEEKIKIGTTATSVDGMHLALVTEEGSKTEIIDKIAFEGLKKGQKYVFRTWVIDKTTGQFVSDTVDTEYTAQAVNGVAEVKIPVDTSNLKGKDIVVYEELYKVEEDGYLTPQAEHKERNDEGQTIQVPDAGTTVTDKTTGTKYSVEGETTLTDVVTFKNLVPNVTYTVQGELRDKETGDSLGIMSKPVEFTPKTKDGSVDVTFTVDTSELAGKAGVVFEEIKYKDVVIVAHKELGDEDQTFYVPKIQTTAAAEGGAVVKVDEAAPFTDTIAYWNLEPNTEYKAVTWVVNKETQAELTEHFETIVKTGDNKDGEFVIDDMTLNTLDLKGQDVVVFEELYKTTTTSEESEEGEEGEDIPITTHKDIEDEGQTLHVPDIGTTATDKNTTTHTTITGKTTIVDEVRYTNLVPGDTYTVQGELRDKETGDPLGIMSEPVEFVAEAKDGSQFIEFEVDTSELVGRSVVAFEEVKYKDVVIVAHKDLGDDDQTVNTPGKLQTTANSANGKTVEAGADVVIKDRVEYKNLTPGEKYTLKGWVVDESGNAVSQEVTKEFTADSKDGFVDMDINVNTSGYAGQKLVVFEEAYTENKTLITEHKDLNDEGQTVYVEAIPDKPTPRTTPKTGDFFAIGAYAAGAAIAAGIVGITYKRRKKTN